MAFSSSFRIIHDNGYNKDECSQYKPVVYSNTVQSLSAILRAMNKLEITFDDKDREVSTVVLTFYPCFSHSI